MSYSKESLTTLYNLTSEQVKEVLSSAKLPLEQPEYTDEEIEQRFKPVAVKLFGQESAQLQTEQANGKGKKSSKTKRTGLQDSYVSGEPSTSGSREQLLQQIQGLVAQAGGLSGEEFAQLLPELAQQRRAELIEMFDRGLLSRLSQMTESGELEQKVRQSALGKKSLASIPSLFLEGEVIEESSSPPLLSAPSNNKSSS